MAACGAVTVIAVASGGCLIAGLMIAAVVLAGESRPSAEGVGGG